ncbi:MAG: hypothetical protein ACLTNO_00840 [Blautia sp.]
MDDMMQIMLKIGDLVQNLDQLGKSFLIVALVAGLLNCFLGYKLLRLWVTVVGLVAGGLAGLFVSYRVLHADFIVMAVIGESRLWLWRQWLSISIRRVSFFSVQGWGWHSASISYIPAAR